MSKSTGASVVLLIVAFGDAAALAQPLGNVLDCTGPFAKDASEASLKKHFGADNVAPGDIDIGEGATDPGTIVFANDPKRRIEVLWHDGVNRRLPATIALTGASTWVVTTPSADRRSFGLGASLAQVEAANGRAFTLNGFGWANGGTVVDWKGGALGTDRGCRLDVRFDVSRDISSRAYQRVFGGRRFSSSDPAMRPAKPAVWSISLYWQSDP